jgi:hypothetical protein
VQVSAPTTQKTRTSKKGKGTVIYFEDSPESFGRVFNKNSPKTIP